MVKPIPRLKKTPKIKDLKASVLKDCWNDENNELFYFIKRFNKIKTILKCIKARNNFKEVF